MEALWNLEDKWRLSTKEAFLVFVCSAFAVIGLCTVTVLKRKAQRKQMANHVETVAESSITWSETHDSNNWVKIRRMLMESMRWSEANKWEEKGGGRPPPPPASASASLLGLERCDSSGIGWQSHNSVSPVWQRPILMGEKCELPIFSGLILYDERGRLLDHSLTSSREENIHQHQEKPAGIVRTRLKDLL
eukprot:XP_002531239.2 uncharacterized protein LOC8269042 [Ricinus communis]